MTTNESTLAIRDLKNTFRNRELVNKAELREFYRSLNPGLTEEAFRRILYALEKEERIVSIGAGVYALPGSSPSTHKREFLPKFSAAVQDINSNLKTAFPYTPYLIWETRFLHEFMVHQPNQNQVILEIDKEATESVFNHLKSSSPRTIFLEPDKTTFERYIVGSPESVLVLRLVTQSPRLKMNGVVSAKLEKILVDIFSDEDRFFVFHGQEMINIFENAFSTYWINPKTLFRYASRRKASKDLRTFINTKTKIDLLKYTENLL